MGEQVAFIDVGFEQCEQVGLGPQGRGAQIRLEDGLVLGIHESHRYGADAQQGILKGGGLFRGDGEAKL